jgi:hypothetical protein
VTDLLPTKLALELVYLRRRTFLYDLRVIARTIGTILQIVIGRRDFPEPPEMGQAAELLRESQRTGRSSPEPLRSQASAAHRQPSSHPRGVGARNAGDTVPS